MELTMLGTGNALVTECYNTCFVLQEDQQYFMVDGGGGSTILHLIPVADDESVSILSKKVTFFDIQSTKAKQFGFCMELGNGEKLTCCGDEPYNPCEKQFAENSTWLLHEAFCLESEADIFHPYEKHHSTVADASKLAEELHVKNLLLYHTEDINLLRRKELYQNEGRKYFNGIIFVPEDLETLVL